VKRRPGSLSPTQFCRHQASIWARRPGLVHQHAVECAGNFGDALRPRRRVLFQAAADQGVEFGRHREGEHSEASRGSSCNTW
jgi:hypothetical protein